MAEPAIKQEKCTKAEMVRKHKPRGGLVPKPAEAREEVMGGKLVGVCRCRAETPPHKALKGDKLKNDLICTKERSEGRKR